MTITMAQMTESHVPACAEILATTPLWVDAYSMTYDSAQRAFREGLADPRQTLRVALAGEQVVGLTSFVERGAFYYGGYLRLLAVHASQRNRGIGARLLVDCEARATPSMPHLLLMATATNTRAHRFYERHGYTHAGTLPDFAAPGTTEFIFWKRLVPHDNP